MAQTSGAHGHMDIQDQKETFHGFLMATVWTCGHIAQLVALLLLDFDWIRRIRFWNSGHSILRGS